MLLIHGTGDLWVPIEQSEELAKQLEKVGAMHRLIRVQGALHGFDAELKISENADLLTEIFAFLKNVWNAPSR
jgi:dipeptidyl aminopeptidase/acylaminoacyl peptidase